MAESFVNTFKRDYLTRMDLRGVREVLEQLPAAFEHLNELHPFFLLGKALAPRVQGSGPQGLTKCSLRIGRNRAGNTQDGINWTDCRKKPFVIAPTSCDRMIEEFECDGVA